MEKEGESMKKRDGNNELSAPEKHLLLTGDPDMKPGRYKGWLRPFMLVSPAGRDELKELWFQHRDELLAEWKQEGHRGLPWAAKEFD
jgi:hypothetical protein